MINNTLTRHGYIVIIHWLQQSSLVHQTYSETPEKWKDYRTRLIPLFLTESLISSRRGETHSAGASYLMLFSICLLTSTAQYSEHNTQLSPSHPIWAANHSSLINHLEINPEKFLESQHFRLELNISRSRSNDTDAFVRTSTPAPFRSALILLVTTEDKFFRGRPSWHAQQLLLNICHFDLEWNETEMKFDKQVKACWYCE